MKKQIKKFALTVIALAVVAVAHASCPVDVYCPFDGERMMSSWECHYNHDNHQVCEFIHNTYDPQGNPVQHYTLVDCGQ